jgi:diguanylate cyclase (GGDEF)-like protein
MTLPATHAIARLGVAESPWLDGIKNSDDASNKPPDLDIPTEGQSRLAFAVVVLSILALFVVAPFARLPLPEIVAFIPSYESALAVSDLVTAILLFVTVDRQRAPACVTLACGYLFNAAMVALHALSFPGAFSVAGLLGGNDQTTAWLFIFWHGGFPLFVIGYAFVPDSHLDYGDVRGQTNRTIILSILGVLAIVAALAVLVTAGHALLPEIIRNGDYSLMISSGVSPAALALSILALIALWRRHKRTVLDIWLMVVMCAWTLDIALSAVVSASRYDLGWYAGRSYGLVAACCLQIVLLYETSRLHRRLTDALAMALRLEQNLTFRAEYDSLTRLPNRSLFYERIETAMTRCRLSKSLMAVLYIDIDNFKEINDSLGHGAGDEVLLSFAQRLSNGVRSSDTVARLGGDEFTIILENLTSREIAQGVVNKLMGVLRRPYGIGKNEIDVRASIGIAYFAGEELNADGLIKQADTALYEAKQRGRNRYSVAAP